MFHGKTHYKWPFSIAMLNIPKQHNYGKSPFLMGKFNYKWPNIPKHTSTTFVFCFRHRLKGDILFNANLDATQVLATCHGASVSWDDHPTSTVGHRKIRLKPSERFEFRSVKKKIYPLVMTNVAIERSTMLFMGKIHYFDWAIFNSYFDITRG